MYFMQKSNVIFRNYKEFGYITDNRNFGYKLLRNKENDIGDKILSQSGSIFFSVLDKKPRALDELVEEIKKQFTDVDIQTLNDDAYEFYCNLEQEGFVSIGGSEEECNRNDSKFSYQSITTFQKSEVLLSTFIQPEISTQDHFEKYFRGEPQLTNLHIEITSKCNERCIHCYFPDDRKVNHIESDLFNKVIEQCREMNLLHITISGGEPMLHNNFCEFLRKCRKFNFSVNVLSNLTLLTDEIIEEMKANPLLGVQVSLYSMDAEIHDGITRMKGSFEKTKRAILSLVDNDIPLQISCPIMKENKDCYKDVVKWAEQQRIHVGADFVILGRFDNKTQNLQCRLSQDEVKEIIKCKISSDKRYVENIRTEVKQKVKARSGDSVCSVCRSTICIADNGNVYPCAGWQGYVVGNINYTKLKDIWEHSDRVKYLRNVRYSDFPQCIECKNKDYCTICLVRNANESAEGDPLEVNKYFCELAELNKNIIAGQ